MERWGKVFGFVRIVGGMEWGTLSEAFGVVGGVFFCPLMIVGRLVVIVSWGGEIGILKKEVLLKKVIYLL